MNTEKNDLGELMLLLWDTASRFLAAEEAMNRCIADTEKSSPALKDVFIGYTIALKEMMDIQRKIVGIRGTK